MIDLTNETDDENLKESEWKDITLRHSLAISSIIKVNEVKSSTFFNKNKLSNLASYLEVNKSNIIFVNYTLTITQKRNLEKYLNNYLTEKLDRVRKYNLKSAEKEGDATDTHSDFSAVSDTEVSEVDKSEKVKVLDRFDIILFIFASRAKSLISKYQLELAYLKAAKAKLHRGGLSTYQSFISGFSGLITSEFIKEHFDTTKEIVSGKQSAGKGSVGGSGETQLEIEKRNISNREKFLKDKLTSATTIKSKEIENRKSRNLLLPSVSLIGYTNSGKTAIMNLLTKADLESEDKLFQTLSTTIKKVTTGRLGGNSFLLLDTVGFISNLPHELVESFKSTLEETFHSDILLHIIDISNPMWEYQSKIVYSILDEIYPDKNYKHKVIEIWNKIDLLPNMNNLKDKAEGISFPVVPISALNKTNLKGMMSEIKNKIDLNFEKSSSILQTPFDKHYKILEWLRLNVGEPDKINYSNDGAMVAIKISMTKGQNEAYLQNFVRNN